MPLRSALAAALVLAAGPAAAQLTPAGPATVVNQTTAGNQAFADAATLADGSVAVVWQSEGLDGSGLGVALRRYDAAGNPLSLEAQVNQRTDANQSKPRVAALASGGFVVVWQGPDADGLGVYARIYDLAGAPVGTEFRANGRQNTDQARPDVAGLEAGGFVVTWDESRAGLGADVFAVRFDAAGTALGSARTHRYRDGDQSASAVAGLEGGGFVVAWESEGQDGSASEIYARRFDASGDPLTTEEERVNVQVTGQQVRPAVAGLEGGGFVAAWQSPDENGTGIALRRFGPAGQPLGPDVLAVDAADQIELAPALASLGGGRFAVAWQARGTDDDVVLRTFDGDAPEGPSAVVHGASTADERAPTLARAGTGVLVAWHGFGADGDRFGVEARRFDDGTGPPPPVGERFLVSSGVTASSDPDVAPLDGGGFVVAWGQGPEFGEADVAVRRFDGAGGPVGGPFVVNETLDGRQEYPSVAGVDGGGFVVGWRDVDDRRSRYRGYDAAGVPTTAEIRSPVRRSYEPELARVGARVQAVYYRAFDGTRIEEGLFDPATGVFNSVSLVNDPEAGSQVRPEIAALTGGRTFAVWEGPSSSESLIGRRIDVFGEPILTVDDTPGRTYAVPKAAGLTDGGFVVVWSGATDGDGAGVFARRFDASFAPAGAPFQVNTTTTGDQSLPAVAGLDDGGFVVVWRTGPLTDTDIYGQRYDAAGTPVGGEFALAATSDLNDLPEVAPLTGSRYVVVWRHEDDVVGAILGGPLMAAPPAAGLEAPPPSFALGAPRPNPTAGRVTLPLALPAEAAVRLEALDALGRVVLTRDLGTVPAGGLEAPLDVSGLAPGVYVIRAVVEGLEASTVLARTVTVVR